MDRNYDSFIYTHIPKCGGTSFRNFINDSALASGVSADEIYIPGCNNLSNDKNIPQLTEKELNEVQIKPIKVLATHAQYNVQKQFNLDIKNPFYFTILREPIARFISHYNFFYYKNGYDNLKGVRLDQIDKQKLSQLLKRISNIQVKYLSNIKHIKIVGLDNMLKLAKYNLIYEYQCFGILEYINVSLEDLRKKSPDWINLQIEFPEANTNKSSSYDLDEEVVEIIKSNHKHDIALYKFALDIYKRNLANV